MGGHPFSSIRQFTAENKLISKCSLDLNAFCIKHRPQSHPKSIQKLCRIPDRILLNFEIASELILEGLGNVKVIKLAFRSLEYIVLESESSNLLRP